MNHGIAHGVILPAAKRLLHLPKYVDVFLLPCARSSKQRQHELQQEPLR
jgi:hypothetical protein